MKKNSPGCGCCGTSGLTCTPCPVPFKNLTLTYSYTSTVDGTTKTFSVPLIWSGVSSALATWDFARVLFPSDSALGTTGCNWLLGFLHCNDVSFVNRATVRYFTYTANNDASICGTTAFAAPADLTVGQFVCSPYMVKFPNNNALYPANKFIVTDP